MGQHRIDLILEVSVLGQNLTGLHCLHDLVDKGKPLPVSRLNGSLIRQVNTSLHIGGFLDLSPEGRSSLDHFLQAVTGGGNGVYHRTAQLGGQCRHINIGFLLLVDIVLVQRHNNGDAQL